MTDSKNWHSNKFKIKSFQKRFPILAIPESCMTYISGILTHPKGFSNEKGRSLPIHKGKLSSMWDLSELQASAEDHLAI